MRLPAVTAIAAAVLTLAACGSEDEAGSSGSATAAEAPAKPADGAAPSPIAANLAVPNLIIEGGTAALDAKLAELAGAPVVVNRWASWCPPCREELPFFNESAQSHSGDVAFVGINTLDDSTAAAEGFLSEVPIVFPSIEDADGEVARELGIGNVSPGTAFIDAAGEVVYARQGAYPDREGLESDIERHLLAG